MDIQRNAGNMAETVKAQIVQKVMHAMPNGEIPVEEGRQLIHKRVYEDGRNLGLSIDACLQLSNEIFDNMFKLGPLQKYLDDPSVSEIMINGFKVIHIEKDGVLMSTEDAFESEEAFLSIIQSMVSKINRRVNQSTPIVDGRLDDGSRLHVVLNPVALNGPIVTIRKFKDGVYTLKAMVENQQITVNDYNFLVDLVKYKFNIFISGGTSSGKTTFLNAMAQYIPNTERVVTIEDSAELNLSQVKNLVRLETKVANADGEGAIDMAQLIKASLRMRPDRIVVGEVRGKEALDMIHAMNTGHDGSLSTGHGNSSKDMLRRLELMILKAIELPQVVLERLISSSIDVVIHLERGSLGRRYVREITEIVDGHDGYCLNPLYKRIDGVLTFMNDMKNKEKYERYKN